MEYEIEIVPFTDENAIHFSTLNKAWLRKYFEVEPIDEIMLANPRQYIIDKGGFIFFALLNKEVAGTFALIKDTGKIFELSKMAVDEQFQGKSIGNKMLAFCMEEAARMNLDKITLLSNTSLARPFISIINTALPKCRILNQHINEPILKWKPS